MKVDVLVSDIVLYVSSSQQFMLSGLQSSSLSQVVVSIFVREASPAVSLCFPNTDEGRYTPALAYDGGGQSEPSQ